MIDYDLQHTPMTEEAEKEARNLIDGRGVREWLILGYGIPKEFFKSTHKSGPSELRSLGALVWYADKVHVGGKKRILMDVDKMVDRWVELVVAMCTAHTKDEEDRAEASVEECLSPILTAPVKQIREFGPKLLEALKKDKRVPYLAWRGYEIWVGAMAKAPDGSIVKLKIDLAKEIAEIVESDVREQIPEAVARALQWRDPETLEKMKDVLQTEKLKGNKARLKGRESCLFLEAGGTEDHPEVCVQL